MKNIRLEAAIAAATLLAAGAALAEPGYPAPRQALGEYEEALKLVPNPDRGRELFRKCAICHLPEGSGTESGSYPQIAGQINTVVIKQLADIRARNRDVPTMFPFSDRANLGGPHDGAYVAAYVSALPMTPNNGKGPGHYRKRGEALYRENCAECHGDNGEGDQENHIPALYGQHYRYLVRQFEWIRMGRQRNADPDMVEQIRGFTPFDVHAIMDYVSGLQPPAEKLAEPGWRNPDFPSYTRRGWYPR